MQIMFFDFVVGSGFAPFCARPHKCVFHLPAQQFRTLFRDDPTSSSIFDNFRFRWLITKLFLCVDGGTQLGDREGETDEDGVGKTFRPDRKTKNPQNLMKISKQRFVNLKRGKLLYLNFN